MSSEEAFNSITIQDLEAKWPDKYGRTADEALFVMDAIKAVRNTPGGWEFMKTYEPDRGFMFSKHPKLSEIESKIDQDGTIGHSGSSYGWTMRQVERIVKNGL
jgi:hypothetical protein